MCIWSFWKIFLIQHVYPDFWGTWKCRISRACSHLSMGQGGAVVTDSCFHLRDSSLNPGPTSSGKASCCFLLVCFFFTVLNLDKLLCPLQLTHHSLIDTVNSRTLVSNYQLSHTSPGFESPTSQVRGKCAITAPPWLSGCDPGNKKIQSGLDGH